MDITQRDEMIDVICKFSDNVLEPCVKPRLQSLKGKPHSEILDEWLGIIDDCVFAAWSNDFLIKSMHTMWLRMGGTEESLAQRNRTLHEELTLEQKKDLQQRFKWQCRTLYEE